MRFAPAWRRSDSVWPWPTTRPRAVACWNHSVIRCSAADAVCVRAQRALVEARRRGGGGGAARGRRVEARGDRDVEGGGGAAAELGVEQSAHRVARRLSLQEGDVDVHEAAAAAHVVAAVVGEGLEQREHADEAVAAQLVLLLRRADGAAEADAAEPLAAVRSRRRVRRRSVGANRRGQRGVDAADAVRCEWVVAGATGGFEVVEARAQRRHRLLRPHGWPELGPRARRQP